jgi:hypothetical protein
MIDNVVLIVTGTLHERDVHELLEKCHPLGLFDRYYRGISTSIFFWLSMLIWRSYLVLSRV